MLNKTISKTIVPLIVILAFLAAAHVVSAQAPQCKAGSINFTCPDGFEKLPNVDDTTSLFKFQYKETVVYFFVANPSGKFDHNPVLNAVGTYYPGGVAAPFRWKEMKESQMMSMRTLHEKQVASWLGYDGTHLINVKTAAFTIDNKNVVIGYAWDWGSKFDDKQQKFKKAADLGDQSFGCNALATTLNSVTREFPQGRQYCYMSTIVNDK